MTSRIFSVVIALIIGALLGKAYEGSKVPVPSPDLPVTCRSGDTHCVGVAVISVNGQPQVQSIADEHVAATDTELFWELGQSGYVFAAEGIEPKASAPRGELICKKISDIRFTCHDNHTVKGPIGYTVTVQAPNGTPVVLDPFIINH